MQPCEHDLFFLLVFFLDGSDAIVTGMVLYRNLASILSFHR